MAKYEPLLSEQVVAAMKRLTSPLVTVNTIREAMDNQFSSGSITQALHVLRCDGRVRSYPTKPFLYKLEDNHEKREFVFDNRLSEMLDELKKKEKGTPDQKQKVRDIIAYLNKEKNSGK